MEKERGRNMRTYAGITTFLEGKPLLKMLKKERDMYYRLAKNYQRDAVELDLCIRILEEETE